ncbi:MAG: DUF4194 domain-containing protein [Acholeplasmataceae bacterium]|jgi:hypothetical protein|nr:DUF4194 domain-containing protein [Acholeplasmataceae bacterium]
MNKTQAAKQFNDAYSLLKEGEKTIFSRIVNKLFQVNFLTKKKPGDVNDYRFILAFKEIFEAYYQIADFSLHIERDEEVVYITNDNFYNHMRLKKTESILILVIRILYQRKKDFVTLDENVEIFLHEIHSELMRIGYLDHKRITKDRLKPALSFLRNYNIIDYIDRGLHDDARIKIYPTILYITNLEGMKEVIQKLDGFVEGGAEDDEEVDED